MTNVLYVGFVWALFLVIVSCRTTNPNPNPRVKFDQNVDSDGSKNQLDQLLLTKTITSFKNDELLVRGTMIALSSASQHPKFCDAHLVALVALDTIFIDQQIVITNCSLNHLVLIAPNIRMIGNQKIILDGAEGPLVSSSDPSKMKNVINKLDARNVLDGAHGTSGLPGMNGKNMFLIGQFFSDGQLEISANGGRGGRGTDGTDAFPAANGRDLRDDQIDIYGCGDSMTWPDVVNSNMLTRAAAPYGYLLGDSFTKHQKQFMWQYAGPFILLGEAGQDGGNGGDSGQGGVGGHAGQVTIVDLNGGQTQVKYSAADGAEGPPGQPGLGSSGGFSGRSKSAYAGAWDYSIMSGYCHLYNITSTGFIIQAQNGINGVQEGSNSNRVFPPQPKYDMRVNSRFVNIFRRDYITGLLQQSSNHSIWKTLASNFLEKVEKDIVVQNLSDVVSLVDEYVELESNLIEFRQLNLNLSHAQLKFVALFESLQSRVETKLTFLSEKNDKLESFDQQLEVEVKEQKAALAHIYSAILEQIVNLKADSEDTFLVHNLELLMQRLKLNNFDLWLQDAAKTRSLVKEIHLSGIPEDSTINNQQLRKAMRRFQIVFKVTQLINSYNNALYSFKLWAFPFSSLVLQKSSLLPIKWMRNHSGDGQDYIKNLTLVVSKNIDTIVYVIVREMTTFQNPRQDLIHADFQSRSTQFGFPFYRWTSKDHGEVIRQLFVGRQILLKAHIGKSPLMGAIKFNEIGIRMTSDINSSTCNSLLEQIIGPVYIQMEHSGYSEYRYKGELHVLKTDPVQIEFSLLQCGNTPCDFNYAYQALSKGNAVLSPYTLWKININSINSSDPNGSTINWTMLEPLMECNVSINLIGRGTFIEEPIPPIAMSKPIADTVLGDVLQPDTTRRYLDDYSSSKVSSQIENWFEAFYNY